MPNHHIYHYRTVGRPYKYMTYLLTVCLAFTTSMLLYTNRERFAHGGVATVESDRRIHIRGIGIPEQAMSQNFQLDRSQEVHAQTQTEDVEDVFFKAGPFQPLAELLVNALYGKIERSQKQSHSLIRVQHQSSEIKHSENRKDPEKSEGKSKTVSKSKTKRPTTRKPITKTTKKSTAKPDIKSSANIKANKTNYRKPQLEHERMVSRVDNIEKERTHDGFESMNIQRLKRVADACLKFSDSLKNLRPQAEFYHSPQHNLLYCKVAKGGCTFWEQLFSFILRPDSMISNNYTTMYDIPRWRIHFDKDITPPYNYWWWSFRKSISRHTTRFMFTRDPFTRIWSAYIDKIWLPDFWFWLKIGNHNTLNVTDRCLYDISFSDFVKYVSIESKSNKHWAPVHQSCNPCVFQPHIIGNMSTFVNDAKHILKTSGLESVLSIHDHKERVRKELKMLVEYNYRRLEQRQTIFKYCKFTEKDLAYRLWKAFQVNGYISQKQIFPTNLSSFGEKDVLASILLNVAKYPLSHEENAFQRQFYLHQAYRSVPRNIMEGMIRRFEADFELFDFDKNPPFLLKQGEVPVTFKW